ncbi:sphingomyelin phosphodiesterase 4 isoform X2 [Palaemon carinicauda]|uniref:sphingomyelin phosphodiesterase 4 isoform X2 n=1 Tax=Palaemon carinicauda TaxID=392227 RepID=UPI0035B5AA3E
MTTNTQRPPPSSYINMAVNPLSLGVRLQNAINQPILQLRCEEVGRILNEATSKDASFVFRTVVESIFGLNGQLGWGLRTITHSALPREFEQLCAFLSASGPLLSFTYRLANDPFLLFEFPVAWLPAKSRAEIEEGVPGNFYVNKIQNPGPGKTPANILLNAFEFYIFHFAHFLVNGSNQRWSLSWSTSGDALYPSLLEDYLRTFLPCDGSVPPGPPSPPVSPRGVLSPMSPRGGGVGSNNLYLTSFGSPIGWRPPRSNTVNPGYQTTERSGPLSSTPLQGAHNQHPQLNIWTSQAVIQVFIEMWVNQCLPVTRSPGRSPSSSAAPPHAAGQYTALHACSVFSEHTPLEYRPNWHTNGFEVFVPSSDHVRVVRMLIKHLHFFSNSGKSAQPSPLDDLRKNLWTMYRKSLYQFLCHTFSHWPLDSSFRLVLETWLSYIQPWRYTEYASANIAPSPANIELDSQRIVESKWKVYIAENLLFYTLLFYHLVCRLFRLDLSAPKNAQILFRVTKVYSQGSLCSYIREIEVALEDPHFMHRTLIGAPHALGSHSTFSGLAGDHFPARSLASVARAHISEMEGPSYSYMAMFSPCNVTMMESLLRHIRRAHDAVSSEQQQNLMTNSMNNVSVGSGKGGWWCSFKKFFETSSPSEDDTAAEDIRKTVIHLDNAQRQLSAIYNLPVLSSLEFSQIASRGSISQDGFDSSFKKSSDEPSSPQHIKTEKGPILTNYGRYQLLTGFRRLDLKYEGDPDLRPICTYEMAFLVRWLYALSVLINSKYGQKMKELYFRGDLVGFLLRLFLKAPETVFELCKNNSGSPHSRVRKDLPPRLSLRFQASKHVIGYELAFCLVFYILGLWGFLLKVLLTLLAVAAGYYVFSSYILRQYLHHGTSQHQREEQQASN